MPVSKASANAITPAAKGAIAIGSGTNAASVLAVGTNDYVLTADSTQTTGVKWAAASSGGMTLLYTVNLAGSTTVTQNVDFTGYKQALIFADNCKDASNTYNMETKLNNNATLFYGVDMSFNSTSVETVAGSSIGQRGSGGAQKSNTITEFVLTINNPASTTQFKGIDYNVTYTRNTAGDPIWVMRTAGFFRSTSAITSIVWTTGAGNFATGSQVLIYGVK